MPDENECQECARQRRIDLAIAKQLQASMERNARMVKRLQDLKCCAGALTHRGLDAHIEAILQDRDAPY